MTALLKPLVFLVLWKKALCFLLFFVFFVNFSCMTCAFAAHAPPQNPLPAPHSLAEKLDVKVTYIPNEGVYINTYNARKYLADLFTILAPYSNFSPQYVATTGEGHAKALALMSGEANIIGLLSKSPERMFRFKFGKYPIASPDVYLVTDASKNIYYNDLDALNGKSVAILSEGSEMRSLFDEFVAKNNIQMELMVYTDYLSYLYSGADYHLMNSFYFAEGKQVAATLGRQHMYFATLPKYTHILEDLDAALEKAYSHDVAALQKLYKNHVSKSSFFAMQTLTPEEVRIMQKPRKVTEVGYMANHFPIQYQDELGNPAGISMGIVRLMEKIHKNPTNYTAYSSYKTTDITKFDMLFSLVGDRELKTDFFYASEPYAQLPLVFFTRKQELNYHEGHAFGMLDYSVLDRETVQKHFPQWKLKVYATTAEVMTAYTNKELDGILLTEGGAENVIARMGISDNKIIPTSLTLPLRFYLSKRYPVEGLNVLNALIDKLDPLAVQEVIITEENNMRDPSTVHEHLEENMYALTAAGIMLAALLVMAYVQYVRIEKRKWHTLLNVDSLTGLSTTSHVYAIMNRVLKKARPGEYMAMTLDVDKFSLLNQVYGSAKGDAVLCYLAERSKNHFEGVGIECLARLRDDVFFVFLKRCPMDVLYNPEEFFMDVSDGVKEILQSNYTISLSGGYYIIDDVSLSPETIVDYCSAARKHGKKKHGYAATEFNEAMLKEMNSQKQVLHRMEDALANEEFKLHFQPKVSLQTQRLCGAEVLVRWHPRNAPSIYPDAFIPVFESNAFIAKLDMYVFKKTCQFIQNTRGQRVLPPLAVNLSGMSVLHNDTFPLMSKYMQEYSIAPEEIEIEITESALVAESSIFLKAMDDLNSLGCKIAIDDFGTGVSSLHRLSSLKVDVVKLDKAFLDDKLTQKKGVLLVHSMIQMLHRLDISVVAEGVETARQVEILKKIHCDVAQGYYFAKPMSEQDFTSRLRVSNYVPMVDEGHENSQMVH